MIKWSEVDTSPIEIKPTIKPGPIVLVRRPKKRRIYGGSEQRFDVLYKGKRLRGYIADIKVFGSRSVTTNFNGATVEGKNLYWLLRRNCITVKKPEGYKEPMVLC